ncbi:hypothetical protein [Hymenobacter sp. CRA2]|uniref:hypothetical protein n=1 Tax=Hymenobacter sp. CRA2 TaxID=1955620 RepID=UPI00098F5831|nr:hypothetical protein [Hymenobacter sp. CRA2]OON69994.1 hypothetical protein B0919_04405 [Hymenobacter sp. CRA2]
MNKLFCLAAAAALVLTAASHAQAQEPTLNDRATTLTQQMAQKVPLNEAQFVKVRRLNLNLLAATQELKGRFANDSATLDQRLAELQDNYEWDMAAILWPRQLAAYQRTRANMTALGSSTEQR